MENWVNGTVRETNETDSTLYYSQQSKDPLIADCEPTILYSHAKVSTLQIFIVILLYKSIKVMKEMYSLMIGKLFCKNYH